ncbi:MAG TPA: DUF4416 family protein [bacterium]|nr:DUF4416 family protein [bacterium]
MQAEPVKLFAALLYREPEALEAALRALAHCFSAVDHRGAATPFDASDYYAPEMGTGLQRLVVGFSELLPPQELVQAKWQAHRIEHELSVEGRRRVNVDIGYLDRFKVVLASFKARGNKIYLGQQVWADLTLVFQHGRWEALPWTFPDFRAGRFHADLLALRQRYLAQLRGGAAVP